MDLKKLAAAMTMAEARELYAHKLLDEAVDLHHSTAHDMSISPSDRKHSLRALKSADLLVDSAQQMLGEEQDNTEVDQLITDLAHEHVDR